MAPNGLSDLQRAAVGEAESIAPAMADFHQRIWSYAEPAWREYRSAAAYVAVLREEGFEVEEGSGGMPTAFNATWGEGKTLGMYAEYDATPGRSQDAVPYRASRPDQHVTAPGWTDSHAALGTAALSGVLAVKRTLERTGTPGRISFFGEPAEKVCGSKPVHAAKGYYDDLDFVVSYHPGMTNTAFTDYMSCLYWSVVFTFECDESEPWFRDYPTSAMPHNSVRSPGAVDALGQMITAVKYSKEQMYPREGMWSINEVPLSAANATADNIAPRFTQIQYSWRSPLLVIQQQVLDVLERCAASVAALTNCRVSMRWVTKTRPGLRNAAFGEATHRVMELIGPEELPAEAFEFGRRLEEALGHTPSDSPFVDNYTSVEAPADRNATLRSILPPWQDCTVADDYTEFTWAAPTVRFTTAKLCLNVIGKHMTHWAHSAMNGYAPTIDHMWRYGGKVAAATAIGVFESPALLEAMTEEWATRRAASPKEFLEPLLPADFNAPIDLPWPEYHTTARGFEWMIPSSTDYGDPVVR